MSEDAFADRLARVRRRFVSTLRGGSTTPPLSLPKLSTEAPASASAVGEAYRCVHGIVGVGPTVGFPATGRVAHEVEDLLRPAQNERRGLTDEEMSDASTNGLPIFAPPRRARCRRSIGT